MREKYTKFGKCVYAHFLNTKCLDSKDSELVTLVLFGLNNFRKIVVFGFAIMKEKSKKTLYRVLSTYFRMQDAKTTDTIVIFDNSKEGIRTALAELIDDKIIKCNVVVDRIQFMKMEGLVFDRLNKNKILMSISDAQSEL